MHVQVQVLRRLAQTNRRILAQVLLQSLKIVKDRKEVMPSPDYCCIQMYVSLSVCLCKCECVSLCVFCPCLCLFVFVYVCVCMRVRLCLCVCGRACACEFDYSEKSILEKSTLRRIPSHTKECY